MADDGDQGRAPPKSDDPRWEQCWEQGYGEPDAIRPGAGSPAVLADAAIFRLGDITLTEWAATDMQWWHEMAQSMSAWHNGKTAAKAGRGDA